MLIRQYQPSDNPALCRLGELFWATTRFGEFAELDTDSMLAVFEAVNNNGALFVADIDSKAVGAIGVMIIPFLFNLNYTQMTEVFWFVQEEYRKSGAGLELHKRAEKWAKDNGASMLTMVAVEGPRQKVVDRIYRANGYTQADITYIRRA